MLFQYFACFVYFVYVWDTAANIVVRRPSQPFTRTYPKPCCQGSVREEKWESKAGHVCLPLSRLAGHLRGRVVSLESLEIIPAGAGSFGQDSEYSSEWKNGKWREAW